jgi:hypothetical protein
MISLRILSLTLAAVAYAQTACTEASPSLNNLPAGSAARMQGIQAYDIVEASAHDLDVRIVGNPSGRLRVHSQGGATTQELDGAERFGLSTSRTRVAVRIGAVERTIAEQDDMGWHPIGPVNADAQRALGILLAIDVDLAVQGSSLVFGGTTFASCTDECDRATVCAAAFNASRCAPSVSVCGACLEQEP